MSDARRNQYVFITTGISLGLVQIFSDINIEYFMHFNDMCIEVQLPTFIASIIIYCKAQWKITEYYTIKIVCIPNYPVLYVMITSHKKYPTLHYTDA